MTSIINLPVTLLHNVAVYADSSALLTTCKTLSNSCIDPYTMSKILNNKLTSPYAIALASKHANIDVLHHIITSSRDVSETDLSTYMLHSIFKRATPSVVQTFIDLGASPNGQNSDGWTALHCACYNGDDAVVEMLLKHGADVNTTNTSTRETVLHWAVRKATRNSASIVKRLLDAGADINKLCSDGTSALVNAVKQSNADTVQVLIDRGADLHASLLYNAIMYGSVEKVEILLQAGAHNANAIHVASRHGYSDVVKLLLDRGIDPNSVDKKGQTPCMHARDAETIHLLCGAGANINATSNDGSSALHIAIKKCVLTMDLVKSMVHHGAVLDTSTILDLSNRVIASTHVDKTTTLHALVWLASL